jgi:hypothetical protein
MFKALLTVQWKWSRWLVLLGTIIGFAIPLMSVQAATGPGFDQEGPSFFVRQMQGFSIMYAALAGGAGLAFAMLAWASDHKGRHVYALSLPISRARYASIKFASGLLFLLGPTVGVLLGTVVATAIAPIPAGLHAYPLALTLRFFFASCVAFGLFFAAASSTPRTAGMVIGAILLIFVAQFLLSAANSRINILEPLHGFLFASPGVLSVFTGRWMLVDV